MQALGKERKGRGVEMGRKEGMRDENLKGGQRGGSI
jgi:hypothetical protein